MVTVIAGDAGVGKSTVLRMATRHLCGELLTNGGAVLPIQIPLYFASLTLEQLSCSTATAMRATIERAARSAISCSSGGATGSTTPPSRGAIRIDWVPARLRSEPVMVIFDGIDEFLTNHPNLRMVSGGECIDQWETPEFELAPATPAFRSLIEEAAAILHRGAVHRSVCP